MTDKISRTLVWLLVAFVVSIAAMAIVGALAFSGADGTFDHNGMMGGGWGWAMGLMAIPGILLVVILVVALTGSSERQAYYPAYSQPRSPLDILNERFARGEISQEEYQRVRNQLVH